jgi:hypothetical protein
MTRARDVASKGGMIAIVPSSVSVSSGSASVAANGQVTFTGAVNIMLNNVFSTAYKNYRLVMDVSSASGSQYFTIRFKSGGTIYSNYTTVGSYFGVSGGTGNSSNIGTGNQGVALGYIGYTNGSGSRAGVTADIYQPAEAVGTVVNFIGSGNTNNSAHSTALGSLIHYSDVVLDSMEIGLQTGLNITGTLRVYGYNNG